jgi:hypothetical protein
MSTTGRLAYNHESRRMILTDRSDECDNHEFHCGEVFELKVNGSWHEVRIEHSQDWYLIGLPAGMNNHAKCYTGFLCRWP